MRVRIAILVVFLSAVTQAMELGRGDGVVLIDGVSVPIRFSYGRYAPSVRPGVAEDVLVLLTDRPVAPAALASESELSKVIGRGQLRAVEVRLDEKFQHVRTVLRGKTSATLAGDTVVVRATVASRRLIDATVSRPDAEGSLKVTFRTLIGQGHVFAPNAPAAAALDEPPAVRERTKHAVHQQLDAPNPKVIPGGTPLPPDGGEPARVYLAYQEALKKNDADAARRFLVSARGDELEFMKQLKIPLSSIARTKIQIQSGWVQGDRAIVNVMGTGVESRATSSGSITLLKQNGAWKVGHEDWHFGASGVAAVYGDIARTKAPPLNSGTSLPANGGEPGNVWRAYDRAFVREDLEALKKVVTREEAAEIERHPDEATSFKEWRPTNIRVIGGLTNGSKATLRLEGTPPYPSTSPKGSVTLVKEDGQWKVAAGEDWSTPPEP